MRTWMVAILTIGLFACATKPSPVTGTSHVLTSKESVVGHWKAVELGLALHPDGSYRWARIVSCSLPPCPVELDRGTFDLGPRRIKLHSRRSMGRRVFTYHLGWKPRRLKLVEMMSSKVYSLAYRGTARGR
jgi:hypothetical protein